MEKLISINNNRIPIKEYNGQRVVTFKDIDLVHGRVEGTARRNFNTNKTRFIKDVDFFKIQPNEIRTVGITSPNGGIVITESGYLLLVKSFTDDLSWAVQRELVNSYFREKQREIEDTYSKNYQYVDIAKQLSSIMSQIQGLISECRISESVEEIKNEKVDYSNDPFPALTNAIAPLAKAYNDNSSGYTATYRKVYIQMGCDFGRLGSRYRNVHGLKRNPSNRKLISERNDLQKKFEKAVNQLLTELEIRGERYASNIKSKAHS